MSSQAPARLVPVWRDLLCDGLTPVEAYARLRTWERGGGPLANIMYMLESVGAGGERWARYSVVGVGCRARVTGVWDGDDVVLTITAAPGFTLPAGMPAESRGLDIIAELLAHYRCSRVPDLPRFWGGLCGVWGHDMVRVFEDIRPTPGVTVRRSELPAIDLVVTDTLVVFDNFSQRVRIVACACPRTDGGPVDAIDAAYARIDAVAAALDTAGGAAPAAPADAAAADAPATRRCGPATASSPRSSAPASTSAPATSSRSCCRSCSDPAPARAPARRARDVPHAARDQPGAVHVPVRAAVGRR
jgi:anthranilate synthase component 1